MPTGPTILDLRKSQRRETWYHLPSQIGANCPKQERSISINTLHPSGQLNWKSTTGKSLTWEAIDVAHSSSTSLTSMQGSLLMNTPLTPSSPSPIASTKAAENSEYCAICTP